MTSVALTRALFACLGIGAADVAALNVAVFPALRGEASHVARAAATSPPPVVAARPVAMVAATPVELAAAEPPATAARLEPIAAPAAAAAVVEMSATVTEASAREVAPASPQPVTESPVAIIDFERDSHRVGMRATWTLGKLFSRLRGAPSVVIIGHADATGAKAINERISAERAQAVARHLQHAGVEPARIHVEARGSREPRPDGRDRRVEIFIGGSK